MPSLLYCVTQPSPTVSVAAGVSDAAVSSREMLGVRVYWSDIDNPEAAWGEPESLKKAALEFQQVLREILAVTTPIPFRFPTLLESAEVFEQHLAPEQESYREALERIGNAVQYEIVGTWADEQQADLATPVSGREYLKRREEALGRVAAVESKLKSVTADSVREWRARRERKTHRWFALVPRDDRERFIASLRGAGASQGVRLRLSGPWPPSEFVTPRGSLLE
ncbi:MAG: GvpL/GvpF family gas vesicle protein [Candidatus Korobacteraceae bacterium]